MSKTSSTLSCLFEKLKRRSSSPPSAALVGNNKDVVGEILSRLPMSSVIRFRLVCKQWRSLTSTQSFLEMHENNNQPPTTPAFSHDNNNSCFVVQYFDNATESTSKSDHFNILFFNIDNNNDTQLLSAAATNNNNKMKKKKKKRLEMVREYIDLSRFTSRGGGGEGGWEYAAVNKRKYYHIKLISSYRGFLLFKAKPTNISLSRLQTKEEEDESALIFYNPVTKEQLTVTAPPSIYVYCGFYYHSPTKEYRILYQLIFDPDHHEYQAEGVAKFQVLSLQTKIMRNLKAPSNSPEYCYYPDPSTPPVISNGSLHWIVSEDDRHGHLHSLPAYPHCAHTILSFGMESEKFRTMPHPTLSHPCSPRGSNDRHHHNMNLLEMEVGILCLCDNYHTGDLLRKLEIYVMEDYKKWTWVRRFLIDLEYVCLRDPLLHDASLHCKALQVRHGVILIRFYEEYILYPLNQQQEDDDPRSSSGSSCGMVRKSNIEKKIVFEEQLECTFAAADKKKKRQRFQVEIDQYWSNKLGRLRRMIIKHPTSKMPITKKDYSRERLNEENPSALIRNLVVLTPSLASLQHHTSTGTSNIGDGDGGGNCILSLKYKNHNTTTLTEYYVQRS